MPKNVKWFEKPVARGVGQQSLNPKATISNKGLLSFNRKAVEEYKLAGKKFVKFGLADEAEGKEICFMFPDKEEVGVFKLNVKENAATASIRTFMKDQALPLNDSIRYDLFEDAKAKLLYVKLSQPEVVTRHITRKKKAAEAPAAE